MVPTRTEHLSKLWQHNTRKLQQILILTSYKSILARSPTHHSSIYIHLVPSVPIIESGFLVTLQLQGPPHPQKNLCALSLRQTVCQPQPRALGNPHTRWRCERLIVLKTSDTLQQSNKAIGNPPFIDYVRIKISMYRGISIATFDYQRVTFNPVAWDVQSLQRFGSVGSATFPSQRTWGRRTPLLIGSITIVTRCCKGYIPTYPNFWQLLNHDRLI